MKEDKLTPWGNKKPIMSLRDAGSYFTFWFNWLKLRVYGGQQGQTGRNQKQSKLHCVTFREITYCSVKELWQVKKLVWIT